MATQVGAGGSGKTCVVCGEDCSNKPGTKDNKGRYYCKECHEQASQRRGGNSMGARDGM